MDQIRVDEVRDHAHLRGVVGPFAHVVAQVVGPDRDAVGGPVTALLESSRRPDHGWVLQITQLDRDIWEDVLDVEDEGCSPGSRYRLARQAKSQRWGDRKNDV